MKYTIELKENENGCDIIISADNRNAITVKTFIENDSFNHDKDFVECLYDLLDNTPLTVKDRAKQDGELQMLLYFIESSMIHLRNNAQEAEPVNGEVPTQPVETPAEELIMEETVVEETPEEPKKGSKKKE